MTSHQLTAQHFGSTEVYVGCLSYWDFVHDRLVMESLVVASDDTKHDAHWVHAALKKLISKIKVRFPELQCLFVVSDGGPAHFRNTLNMYLVVQLAASLDIDIVWSFHQGYHGKSIYDPEGGAVKTMLMHAIRNGLISVSNAAEFVEHARSLCSSPKSLHEDKLWNISKREFVHLKADEIDRSFSVDKDVQGVKCIQDTYCFRSFRIDGKVCASVTVVVRVFLVFASLRRCHLLGSVTVSRLFLQVIVLRSSLRSFTIFCTIPVECIFSHQD